MKPVKLYDEILIPISEERFDAISKGLTLPLEFGWVYGYKNFCCGNNMTSVCITNWNGIESSDNERDFMLLIKSKIRSSIKGGKWNLLIYKIKFLFRW